MAGTVSGTVSFYNTPYEFNPVNAQIPVVAYSNDYNVQQFSYLFNIFQYNRLYATESNFLGQYKIPPRPTGEGLFDVHKILKSSVLNDYNFTMTDITSTSLLLNPVIDESCMAKFNYNYGYEEYLGLTFSSTYRGQSGNLALTGTTGYFQLGDIVNIQMSGASPNQQYTGPAEVVNFIISSIDLSPTDAVVNVPFAGTDSNPGMITIYDRILGTSPTYYAINGTRQYYNPILNSVSNQNGLTDLYSGTNYVMPYTNTGSAVYNFLTTYNVPEQTLYKEIFLNQYETISVLSHTQSNYNLTVTTYDANFVQLNTYVSTNVLSQDYILYNVPIGTANLSGLISFTGCTYYTIEYSSNYNFMIARRKIKQNCSVFPNVRMMFLNRVGGWDYFNFDYDSTISLNITRTTFRKTLNWNYQVGDRNNSTLVTQSDQQTIVNSDWITEYDYNWLQELFTSPNVYVIDEITLAKLPVVIQDTTWTQKTVNRDKLFNVSLTFEYSYNINLQTN